MKAWTVWAGAGGALLVGVVGWQLFGSSYKADVTTICEAEVRSGISFDKDHAALASWLQRNVKTAEGSAFLNTLANQSLRVRSERLTLETQKLGIASCPLVTTYAANADRDDYRADLSTLCTGDGTSLEFVTDEERLQRMRTWAASKARSPRTKELLDKLEATNPRERGTTLAEEGKQYAVFSCGISAALDRAPVEPGPGGPHVRPSPAQIQGNLPPDDWRAELDAALPAIRQCYEAEVEKVNATMPDAGPPHGHMTARIHVEPSGKVKSVHIGAMDNTDIDTCVERVFENRPLPRAKGRTALVIQPIDFLP